FALRLLLGSPGSTSLGVLCLAIGLGANAIGLSLVDAVLLQPFPYDATGRLVVMWAAKNQDVSRAVALPDVDDVRRQNRTFDAIGAYTGGVSYPFGESPVESVSGTCIDANVLATLGATPAIGRPLEEHDVLAEMRVILLSDSIWRARFGSDPHVIGEMIR